MRQLGTIGAEPFVAPEAASRASRRLAHESEAAEAALILQALRNNGGNVTEAAAQLGISRTTLWRKRSRYRL